LRLWKVNNKMPEVLFHYTKAQTALEYILADKTLRISQFQFTNDPKESKGLYITALTGIIPSQPLNESFKRIHKVIEKVKLREWKVVCFSQHHPNWGSEAAAFSPFLSGSNRPAMWAHYGSSHDHLHDGICLKFNYSLFQKRISDTFKHQGGCFVTEGSVEYNDLKFYQYLPFDIERILELRELEIEARVREYFLTYCKEIFLLKAKDWENEHEYRWLIHNQNDSPEYVPLDGVLEEVLVSEGFQKDHESRLIALCRELNIPAKRLIWFNGMPDERPLYSL
jgi:hypothetical protein